MLTVEIRGKFRLRVVNNLSRNPLKKTRAGFKSKTKKCANEITTKKAMVQGEKTNTILRLRPASNGRTFAVSNLIQLRTAEVRQKCDCPFKRKVLPHFLRLAIHCVQFCSAATYK